jgi:hypothetical protein
MRFVWAGATAILTLTFPFLPGAFAEQFASQRANATASQPIPGYAFGPNILSAASSGQRFSATATPAETTISFSTSSSLSIGSGLSFVNNSVAVGNPLPWTDARSAVSTYLGTYEKREVSLPSRVRPAASLVTPTSTLLTTQRVGR